MEGEKEEPDQQLNIINQLQSHLEQSQNIILQHLGSIKRRLGDVENSIGDLTERQNEDMHIVELTSAEEVETSNRWSTWRWGWEIFMAVFALHLAYYSPFLVTFYHGKLHHKSTFWWDLAIATVGVIDLMIKWFTSTNFTNTEWSLYICNIIGYLPWISICELCIVVCTAWGWTVWGWITWLEVLITLRGLGLTACERIRWVAVLIAFRAFFILRVYSFLSTVKERISRRYMRSIAIVTLKLVVLTFFWVHLVACIFFGVAMIWHDPSDTWLGSLTLGSKPYDFKNEPEWKNYGICVYYSMSTITTIGYGDIHPVNILEMYVFTLLSLINLVVMSLVGSYFIGPLLTRIFRDENSELRLALRRKQD